MVTTSPDALWSPDGSDGIDDIVADLAQMQTTAQTALNGLRASIVAPTVASAAARDALYPAPVQGNRVFRSDGGWEEAYYGLYNASTNPAGMTPAGWYPIAGSLPKYAVWRNISSNLPTGVWTNWQWTAGTILENRGGFSVVVGAPTNIVVPYRGWYDVTFKQEWAAGDAGDRFLRIDSNGTAPFNSYQGIDRQGVQASQTVTNIMTVQIHAVSYITVGAWNNSAGGLNGVNPQVNITFRQPSSI